MAGERVYTFGYAPARPAALRGHVAALSAVVVDVRLRPWSLHPAWREDAPRRGLPPGRYLHEPGFGDLNRRPGGPVRLADPEAAFGRVGLVLVAAPVILLCACADPRRCHRTAVARLLEARLGLPFVHLPRGRAALPPSP
jgi:uncharacterized protein (DUF488 family)